MGVCGCVLDVQVHVCRLKGGVLDGERCVGVAGWWVCLWWYTGVCVA